MKRTNAIKAILIVICMLAAGICYAGSKTEKAAGLSKPGTFLATGALADRKPGGAESAAMDEPAGSAKDQAGTGNDLTGSAGGQPAAGEQDSAANEEVCYVYICGEVKLPGVYPMAEGSRVYQVVDQAGGFTEAAAAEYLNMADVVCDGLKLVVPAASELPDEKKYGDTSQAQAGQREGTAVKTKVNLNTAGKEALMTLTGIGEARAEDIIRYRTEQGPFQKIEDVMKISGIKDAAFQKIKNDITV